MNKFLRKTKFAVSWALRQIPLKKVTVNIQVTPSNELLKGRTALITGGTSGIGLAIAKAFHLSGCNVVVTGRNSAKLQKACEEIKESSDNAYVKGIVFDVSNCEEIYPTFENAVKLAGNEIDILVNNAGTMGSGKDDSSEFDEIYSTNVRGAYFLSKIFSKHLITKNKSGNILNILSSSSFRPATNPYAISKWGMRGLTTGLARKLIKDNIVVNAIALGPTATPMLNKQNVDNFVKSNSPIRRFILPEEIANIAVILVSDMCKPAIGEIFCMTGGSGNITNEDYTF